MSPKTRTLAILGSQGHIGDVLRELPGVPEFRLTAISPAGQSEPFDGVTRFCAERSIAPAVHTDWRTLLDRDRPDAVVVCGPFELHAEMCIAAIERGIHVLTEKPAALTETDYHRLKAAAEAHPHVHLAAMMKSRFDPGFFAAHRLVSSGAIGDLRLLEARKSYKLGTRPGYYHDRATYGGTIPWVGSHAVDWVLWLAGSARPVTVFAAHSGQHNAANGTMERSALLHLTLEGGRFASVAIDYFRPPTAPTHGDDYIRAVGSRGVLEARPGSLHLINDEHNGPLEVTPPERTQLRDFFDHITGERPSITHTSQTLHLTETCLLALRSADTGQVVSFPA